MPGGFGVMVRYTGLGSGFFGVFDQKPKTPVFWRVLVLAGAGRGFLEAFLKNF